MIFYLSIRTETELKSVPHIEAIDILLNDEQKHCTWDETDAVIDIIDGKDIHYRFKGVSYDDEDGNDYYANGTIDEDTPVSIIKDFWWSEDTEEFEFDITEFTIRDYDDNADKEILKEVV